jgi:integrative and conjugative element protein (TIGR02256 family)
MNSDKLLAYYNKYFSSLKEYELASPFVIKEKGNEIGDEYICIEFYGKITSKLATRPLDIDVKIPLGFPNEKISLTTTSLRNYAHLIANKDDSSWFCLNTPFGETIQEQLDLEIERLSGWIDKYLNNGEKHELAPNSYRYSDFQLFYNEESNDSADKIRFNDVCWGVTECFCLGQYYYPLNLGNNKIELNDTFNNEDVFEKRKLFWLFTNLPPVNSDGSLPNNTLDLNKAVPIPKELDEAFKEHYGISLIEPSGKMTILAENEQDDFFEQVLIEAKEEYKSTLFAVGFYFENKIIWEFARLKPFDGFARCDEHNNTYDDILWGKTYNINQKYFFGRGHFCKQITNAKIAIIGVGAIGSSLAEILTRGGVETICLIDNDEIEHGNICRSSYSFINVGENKVTALGEKLEKISPYINVLFSDENIYSSVNYKSKNDIREFLKDYNIIFDCTASNELLHGLSTLDLEKHIISLGITNEAQNLICITNSSDNIFEKRKFYLSQLEQNTDNLYYEGIGCYTPTFKANYADINSMLNLAVRYINKSFSKKGTADSFILSHTENGIEKNDIVTLYQKELDFTLSISQQCLNEIYDYAKKHLPNEFGGYLMGGYSRNRKHIYLTNILIAEQSRKRRAFFQVTNNDSVHKSISDIFNKSKGMINYIGEWHSHPSMSNHYSSTDFDSIRKQALSEDIYTNNPLLCIVSIDNSCFDPKFYIYYKGSLHAFTQMN